jgi:hypothetical protein
MHSGRDRTIREDGQLTQEEADALFNGNLGEVTQKVLDMMAKGMDPGCHGAVVAQLGMAMAMSRFADAMERLNSKMDRIAAAIESTLPDG